MITDQNSIPDFDTENFPPLSPTSSIESLASRQTEAEKIDLLQAALLEINSKLGIIKAQNESLVHQNNKLTKDYSDLKLYVAHLESKLNITENPSDTHSSGSDLELMDIDEQTLTELRRTKRKRPTTVTKSQPKLKKTSEKAAIPTKNSFQVLQENIPETVASTSTSSCVPSQSTPSNAKEVSSLSQSKTSTVDKTNMTKTTPSAKIPPIVVHNKNKWTAISTYFKSNKIDFVSAKNTDEGIKIIMSNIDSYRKGTKFLELQKIEFHTYQLQEEKLLHVVIRGIPTEIDVDIVKQELQARQYHPTTVRRMVQRKPIEKPLPLIILLLPREEKSIYNVTDLLDLRVRVETLRSKPSVSQCFNCQRFGHAQSKCMAQPKCLKCGSGHPTYTCTKTQATPARCANCGGAHPANFSGCSFRPKPQEKPQVRAVTAAHISQQGTSYASAAKTNTNPTIIPHPLSTATSLNPQTIINSLIQSFVTQLNTFAQRFASSFEPGQLGL